MPKNLLQKPKTFNEAIQAAYQSPNHIFETNTSLGHVMISVMPIKQQSVKKKTTKKRKENVWDKLLRYAGRPELSQGKTDIGCNYKKYLYGPGGIIK